MERLYGIRNGSTSFQGNQYEVVTNKSEVPKKTQEQLAVQMGISVDTLQNYKILSEMIPELEELLDTGVVTKYLITIQMNNLVRITYMCYAYFIFLVGERKKMKELIDFIIKETPAHAYNAAKELMDTESIGAIIFVDNAAYPELKKVNAMLVNMLDAFLTDTSSSSGSNFDDSEKMKMLKEHGAFVLAMLSDNKNGKTTSQDMVTALTAKNIFLPINNDGVVGNIGIINQKGNKIDEHELIKAIGVPENVFVGNNGRVNIACASGLGYPVEYITKLGKSAVEEQKKRMEKRESLSTLDDLGMDNIEVPEIPKKKTPGKRKQITWDFIKVSLQP